MSEDNKKFVIYRSSAGSGKTFTLVKEYLKLILGQEYSKYYRKVLAITFTNAAAAEMKDRVLSQLRNFSRNEDPDGMLELLLTELSIERALIVQRAGKSLKNILHHYSDFKVSTIDSFVHGIIKSFARDLHLDPDFEIEMDAKKVIQLGVENILNKLGDDQKLTQTVVAFVDRQMDDEKVWDVRSALEDYGLEILKETGRRGLEKLEGLSLEDFGLITKKLNSDISSYEKLIQTKALEASKIIENGGLEPSDFSYSAIPKYITYFLHFSANSDLKKLSSGIQISSMYAHETEWYTKKLPQDKKDQIEGIKPELTKALGYLVGVLDSADFRIYRTRLLIRKNMFNLALLSEIEKSVQDWKIENKVLLISDFNELINRIIRNNPAPFIYEKIGERFDHILIDEFQDTSTMQWQNFIPLIENSLSKNKFNLLVGDAKQAIYRWRSGNVLQFVKLPHIHDPLSESIKSVEPLLDYHFSKADLDKNYRSSESVVLFNNELFSDLSRELKMEEVFKNPTQKINRTTKGYVTVQGCVGPNKEERDELSFPLILNKINEAIQLGYVPSDIAILVRKNKVGAEIASYLIDQGIKVMTSDSLLIKRDPLVHVIASFMQFLFEPDNEGAKAQFIIGLNLSDPSISLNENLEKYNVRNGRKSKLNLDAFLRDNYPEWDYQKLLSRSIYSIGEAIVRQFSYNKKPNQYLETFLNLLYDLGERKKQNLGEFVQYWKEKKDSAHLNTGDSEDSVRVMTIHHSKGLQFPVVICPIPHEIGKRSATIWINDIEGIVDLPTAMIDYRPFSSDHLTEEIKSEDRLHLMDELNVLYVALTRAEDRLHLLIEATETQKPDEKNTNSKIVESLTKLYPDFDLLEGRLELGDPNEFTPRKKDPLLATEIEEFYSFDILDQVTLSLKNRSKWDLHEIDSERQFGVFMHEILSMVNDMNSANAVISSKQDHGIIDSETAFNLQKELQKFFDWEDIKRWFETKNPVKKEKGIIDSKGHLLIPDRVNYYENHIEVIDFKTGTEEEKHRDQILTYKDHISKIENCEVKAYLVYTKNKKIVEVI